MAREKIVAANQELTRHVDRYFVGRSQFLHSAGIDDTFFQDLISARALPGQIYRLWDNGSFWSPIGGQVGIVATHEPEFEWYSPAAIWWAGRAKVLASSQNITPEQSCPRLARVFLRGFQEGRLLFTEQQLWLC